MDAVCRNCNGQEGQRYDLLLEKGNGDSSELSIRLCEECSREIRALSWVVEPGKPA